VIGLTIPASVTESATYKDYRRREIGDFAATLGRSAHFTLPGFSVRNH